MKRKDLENELQTLLEKLEMLKEESELNLFTSIFLGNEVDKLMDKANDLTLPYDEREKVVRQLIALEKRLKTELLLHDEGVDKLKALENRVNELNFIFENGQMED